jgi:hypothetical protein
MKRLGSKAKFLGCGEHRLALNSKNCLFEPKILGWQPKILASLPKRCLIEPKRGLPQTLGLQFTDKQ